MGLHAVQDSVEFDSAQFVGELAKTKLGLPLSSL